MNLVLLEHSDFIDTHRVCLKGRRLAHTLQVLRAASGDTLRVGLLDGKLGKGVIEQIDNTSMEMVVEFDADPPAKLPVRLILALPRPKVLNRLIAAAASMGIREIDLINAWRVEKAYWESPRLSEENLRLQSTLGLEQAGDTILPSIRLHRLFTPLVREELPAQLKGQVALLANPRANEDAPRKVTEPLVLAIGPEGGFIDREVETFRDIGFTEVRFGPRILRVETALAFLIGRLF
jgi:16S rRNA (uracil1498-N3)-methyltransferase